MSDPFKIEEEAEETKPVFVSEVVCVTIGDLTGKVIPILSEPKPDEEFVASVCKDLSKDLDKALLIKPLEEFTSPKIHHSTLKKLDKTTINCRLKRENAAWLRQAALPGPGGLLAIGDVLDRMIDEARQYGGAK